MNRPLCQCGHADLDHGRFVFPYKCLVCPCNGWIGRVEWATILEIAKNPDSRD